MSRLSEQAKAMSQVITMKLHTIAAANSDRRW
jgi:hypothetical protein